MAIATAQSDLHRRARLAVVRQDLTTPVRAILGYQEILVEEGERLQLTELMHYFEKVLDAARALSALVGRLADPDSVVAAVGAGHLADAQATLRHDIRTPLNAIIGYTEMVLEDLEDYPAAEALRPDFERLLAEARRLLDRVDLIVDLGRRPGDAPSAETAAATADEADEVIADLMRSLRPAGRSERHEVGRILVVDDDKSSRDLLSRRLSHEGHEVLIADSGQRALDILAGKDVDMIFLDLLMPGMNGIEVLERLKQDERLRRVPVVMISGLSEIDAVIRCIAAGAEDYLPKPFNLVLLRARIDACLERKRWREREQEYLAKLESEKERSEKLLRNILPEPVVVRLNDGETIIADRFESVSILFADIVGFTTAAQAMTPATLVYQLDRIFTEFDSLALKLGIEKIKTIGDAYMAAAGLPEPRADHAEAMAEFALGMMDAVERPDAFAGSGLQMRIGIHSGPVVAGVIGRHKFIYDVWGDTVNVASRLESHGVPGQIQVSEEVRKVLAHRHDFEARGTINLRNRGETTTFLLSRR